MTVGRTDVDVIGLEQHPITSSDHGHLRDAAEDFGQ